jgi:hypothetical protein
MIGDGHRRRRVARALLHDDWLPRRRTSENPSATAILYVALAGDLADLGLL